jgi:hypothetical protein
LKINGSVVREDVFDDFHQIERGVWVPLYGKMKTRIQEGNTEDCFSYKEYLALSAPQICESFPDELFAFEVSDIAKHVIDKQGYYRVGGTLRPDEIEGYREQPSARPTVMHWINTFLFWAGIALITMAVTFFLLQYIMKSTARR